MGQLALAAIAAPRVTADILLRALELVAMDIKNEVIHLDKRQVIEACRKKRSEL